MSLLSIKYHVPSRGQLGNNNIWRIYKDIDQGVTSTEYVEHIEIEEGVRSWTGEDLYRVGYSLLCEGEVKCYIDEATGLRCAKIYTPNPTCV